MVKKITTIVSVLCLFLMFQADGQSTINLPSQCPGGHTDTDWNKSGTTDAPDEITDTIFTLGFVGVGTSDPTHPFHILPPVEDDPFKVEGLKEDSSMTRVLVVDPNGVVRYQDASPGNQSVLGGHTFYQVGTAHSPVDINQSIYTLGAVGIGTTNPSHLLQVNGVARSSQSTWATSSDQRVKENIVDIDNATDVLMQLRPVEFDWLESYREKNILPKTQYGFIAQEVKAVIPRMVTQTTENVGNEEIEDFNLLNTSEMTPLMVKSIQEMNLRISELEEENRKLHSENDMLETRLSHVESVLNLKTKTNLETKK